MQLRTGFGFAAMAVLALAGCSSDTMLNEPSGIAGYQSPRQVTNAESYGWFRPNQIELTSATPVSAFGLDVNTASYAVARRYLRGETLPPAPAVWSEAFLNYFDYGYEAPDSRARPFRISAVVTPAPWNPDDQLLHVGIRAADVVAEDLPPLRLVLVVDSSEKMGQPDRLPLVAAAAESLIRPLTARDRVALVRFGDGATVAVPAVPGDRAASVAQALQSLAAKGRTTGVAGLELAYDTATSLFDPNAVNLVVLVSGGEFEDFGEKVADNKQRHTQYNLNGFARGRCCPATSGPAWPPRHARPGWRLRPRRSPTSCATTASWPATIPSRRFASWRLVSPPRASRRRSPSSPIWPAARRR